MADMCCVVDRNDDNHYAIETTAENLATQETEKKILQRKFMFANGTWNCAKKKFRLLF